MKFAVNLAFWGLLRKKKPKLAKKVVLEETSRPQIFDIQLANDHKGPLDPPTDLNNVLDKIENHMHQDEQQSNRLHSPLLTQSQNNILTVFVTVVMTTATIALVFVAVRHFKLHALVAGLTLTT